MKKKTPIEYEKPGELDQEIKFFNVLLAIMLIICAMILIAGAIMTSARL